MFHGAPSRTLPASALAAVTAPTPGAETGGSASVPPQPPQGQAESSAVVLDTGLALPEQEAAAAANNSEQPPQLAAASDIATTNNNNNTKEEENNNCECWTPSAIWVEAVLPDVQSSSSHVVKVNLMDYIGKGCRYSENLYLPPAYHNTLQATRNDLGDHFVEACAQAGFKLISKGWGEGKIRYCCHRGVLYKNKTRPTQRPTQRQDLCRFKFTVLWDAALQRYYVQSGFGEPQHKGHARLEPSEVPRPIRRGVACMGKKQPPKPRVPRDKTYRQVTIDGDLNWKPAAIWLDSMFHYTPNSNTDDVAAAASSPLGDDLVTMEQQHPWQPLEERVDLMDYLGPEPTATAPIYFDAVTNNPQGRLQLNKALSRACQEAGFKVVSKGYDSGRMRFVCSRSILYRQKEGRAGLASVVQIASMKTNSDKAVCDGDRCHFAIVLKYKKNVGRFSITPGDGYSVHNGHRHVDLSSEGQPKKAPAYESAHAREQRLEPDWRRQWEQGKALERYLPFFKGACNAADYSFEADKLLRRRLEDTIEELRDLAKQKYEKEKVLKEIDVSALSAANASEQQQEQNVMVNTDTRTSFTTALSSSTSGSGKRQMESTTTATGTSADPEAGEQASEPVQKRGRQTAII